jgi:hypothetical protein
MSPFFYQIRLGGVKFADPEEDSYTMSKTSCTIDYMRIIYNKINGDSFTKTLNNALDSAEKANFCADYFNLCDWKLLKIKIYAHMNIVFVSWGILC